MFFCRVNSQIDTGKTRGLPAYLNIKAQRPRQCNLASARSYQSQYTRLSQSASPCRGQTQSGDFTKARGRTHDRHFGSIKNHQASLAVLIVSFHRHLRDSFGCINTIVVGSGPHFCQIQDLANVTFTTRDLVTDLHMQSLLFLHRTGHLA